MENKAPNQIPPAILAQASADVAANPPPPIDTDLEADVADYILIGPHKARRMTAGDIWLIKKLVDKLDLKNDLKQIFTGDEEKEFTLDTLDPLADFLIALLYIICHPTPEDLVALAVNRPQEFIIDAVKWGFKLQVTDLRDAASIFIEYKQTLDIFGNDEQEHQTAPKQ